MKETKTIGNSRHADPTTGSPPIELLPSVAQAARWKYVFPDIKKNQKSFKIKNHLKSKIIYSTHWCYLNTQLRIFKIHLIHSCGVALNRLMTLLESRCQEPQQRKYHPPD